MQHNTSSHHLRDWIGVVTMTPLSNNVYSVLLTVTYVKVGLEIAAYFCLIQNRQQQPQYQVAVTTVVGQQQRRQTSRILVQLCLSTTLLFWPLYDFSHWSWRLNVLVPSAVATRLVYKGMVLKDSEDEDVHIMSRSGSPGELLYGPLQLTFLLTYIGLFHFMESHAAIVMAAVGLGDSIAPWIGSRYGRHVYRLSWLGPYKTMEGSICGVFLGTIVGCYLNLWLMGLPSLPLRILLAYGAIAAVAEGTAPSHVDNIIVPLVLFLFMDRVVEILPQ